MILLFTICAAQFWSASAAFGDSPSLGPVSVGEVQSSSAVLEGGVNPNGLPTTYFFEYSLNSQFEHPVLTSPVRLGASGIEIPVRIQLSSLEHETAYYFRVVAINENGVAIGTFEEGTAGSFETEPVPCESAECQLSPSLSDTTLATLAPGLGNPPVIYHRYCRKGFVKKKGVCVEKKRRRHGHHRRHRRPGSNERHK